MRLGVEELDYWLGARCRTRIPDFHIVANSVYVGTRTSTMDRSSGLVHRRSTEQPVPGEINEVYEQKRIANYWADGAGTVTPPGHSNLIAIDLVKDAGSSTLRAAWLFAALNTAQADAFIACWNAKFTSWSIRPITAIRRQIDPNWNSYIPSPPFPSYVSGHSTTSGAASTVLGSFFPAKADELAGMAEEAAISRLYGGIHYKSDNEVGLALGRRVGQVVVQAYHVDS